MAFCGYTICYSCWMPNEQQPQTSSLGAATDEALFDQRCCEWLEGVATGSEAALGDLYSATLSRLYGVAMRILEDDALAEDVVAEAYCEIWQRADRYDAAKGRPLTWMLTVCRNRAIDVYRRRAAETRKTESAAAEPVPEAEQSPDLLLNALQSEHAVRRVVEGIPAEDRQLIALAFFREHSHQEIADMVRMPLGTVKSRIRRTLKTLETVMPAEVLQDRRPV